MAPRKKKAEEAVVVILDVGYSEEDERTSTIFFQKAKECLLGLIKKKIFAQSQEIISLILMNSDETVNDLNLSADGYDNISVTFPLRSVSWELARLVNDLKPTKKNSVDWLDAIEVALSYVKQEQESDALILSNLVLISRLAGTADKDQAKNVLQQLKSLASEFTVIGYGVDQIQEVSQQYSQSKRKSLARLQVNLSLLSNMVEEMNTSGHKNSALCSFDETLPHLSFFKHKPVRPTPWKVQLEFGSELQFEVSAYKMIAEQERFKWSFHKRTDSAPIQTPLNAENMPNTAIYRDVRAYVPNDDGNEREVAAEDIVKSYTFGDKIVPFSALDRETMSYKSGPRSLKVIAFTKKKNIHKYMLQGNGVYVFTCGKDSSVAFAALYEALVSSEAVGIVRRVYNRDNAPSIGTLYPEIIEGKKVLVFIEIPFAEDEVKLKLPSVRHISPSDEQKNAMNELIDSLDLTDPDAPENDLFCPEKTYDPHLQFMFHVFAHKTLHPEEPSPTEPPEHIKKLSDLPAEIKEKAEPVLDTIKRLFHLEEVYQKRKTDKDAANGETEKVDAKNENVVDEPVGVSSLFKPTVVQVTTVQPVQDFETLLQKGENHTEVCNQMKKVITVLAQRIVEVDDLLKLIEALKTLRKSCLENNFDLYNSWLPELKNLAQERNLRSLWEKINEEKLGLISIEEVPGSSISEEDANSFLQLVEPSLEIETIRTDDDLMMDL